MGLFEYRVRQNLVVVQLPQNFQGTEPTQFQTQPMENGPFIDGLPIENGDFPWLC
jgi:hypothetical protein